MREKRDETIILRLSKTEKNRIYEKMLSMGIRSLSAYIRKMALDGYCLHLDLKDLQRINVLQNSLANGPFCLRKSIFNPFLTNGVT